MDGEDALGSDEEDDEDDGEGVDSTDLSSSADF